MWGHQGLNFDFFQNEIVKECHGTVCDALESFYFEKITEEFNIASDWIVVSKLGWHITCEEVN